MDTANAKLAGKTSLECYLAEHIDEAIERHEITVHYQPIIRSLTGKICAFEALARWTDPIYGTITPSVFLGVLEATNQTHKLDLAVVKEVCQTLASRQQQNQPQLPISLNLSRLDFLAGDFFALVEAAMDQYQLPRELLRIEVTENIFAQDKRIESSLKRFQAAGYLVWLDDFGEGSSSLNVLKNHQFEALKIDMRFLAPFSPRAKTIIESAICMAKKVGIHTIAEGVETKEQADFLTKIGCEKMQGFYFGRPMPLEKALAACEENGIATEANTAGSRIRTAEAYDRGEYLKIFQPIYARRLEETKLENMHFAYYTSATTGINILKGRHLWMRAAACMNDYREIDYGIQLLNHTIYSSAARRQRIQAISQQLHWGSNMLESLLSDLNRNEQQYITHTYLACVSEHAPAEKGRGRLSMWRAYGRKTGVAFVLNPNAIFRPLEPLPLLLSPVEYLTQEQFSAGFDWMLENIERSLATLQEHPSTQVLNYFVDMLMTSLFSIKNPGFVEEREWRFIYKESSQGRLAYDIEVIDGIPQIIYKLPICGPGDDYPGLPLQEALEEIIIGPSQYAEVIRTAYVKLLEEIGINNAARLVSKSNIPLR